MGEIQLLDCTVRDGGYINDWKFGRNRLISIFERLVDSGVDIIEIGFLDGRRPFDIDRSIGPDTASLKKIWGCVKKRPSMVVGMIDYGTCVLENIEPADQSFLDGIRIIFKKQRMHEAMAFCREIREKGYKVFSQLVSITAYDDNELLELIGLVNEVKPYAVSMVDTYGLLFPDKLLHYSDILDSNLCTGIQLGFHAHNNFQMGFANALAFLSRNTERNTLVDGTLYGMGKSAGNAPLELLAMQMNELYHKSYKIEPMLEAIEDSVMPVFKKSPWGYQKFYYMTAKNECHPNYLNYFQKKGSLSQTGLDELLRCIEPEDKKLLYDEEFAEQLYVEYIRKKYKDEENAVKLKDSLAAKSILVVGPGKNVILQHETVSRYISENRPLVISINYLPENIFADYVFITNGSRYEEMTVSLHERDDIKVIATSNVTCKNNAFDYVFMREPLLDKDELFVDNSFLMLLRILKKAKITSIVCAGLDGYSNVQTNYINPAMEYDFVKGAAFVLNSSVQKKIRTEFGGMDITFVTYSHYTEIEDIDSATY